MGIETISTELHALAIKIRDAKQFSGMCGVHYESVSNMVEIQKRISDDCMELPASRLSSLYGISLVPGKGLGISAAREILCDSEVMICAVKELSSCNGDIPFSFAQYLFVDPDAYSDSEERINQYRMVCGDMVFLNHSDVPNCSVSWFRNANNVLFSALIAKRRILIGEELTIRYIDACDYRSNGYF